MIGNVHLPGSRLRNRSKRLWAGSTCAMADAGFVERFGGTACTGSCVAALSAGRRDVDAEVEGRGSSSTISDSTTWGTGTCWIGLVVGGDWVEDVDGKLLASFCTLFPMCACTGEVGFGVMAYDVRFAGSSRSPDMFDKRQKEREINQLC